MLLESEAIYSGWVTGCLPSQGMSIPTVVLFTYVPITVYISVSPFMSTSIVVESM